LLTIDDDYDYESSKLIPKADPNHPTKKPTMSMFAFSETAWEPRAALYLQNILMLREKEWEKIITAAMEYSTTVKIPSKGKGCSHMKNEDELQLTWDTDSDE
jgi:lipopolysaccharide biosynthesis glycosyltransferase